MAGGGILLLVVVLVGSTTSGIGGVQRVMNLQRVFSVNQIVELETLKARDRMRHARMLQSFAEGIINFSVFGTSDPSNAGLCYTKVKLESPPREFNVQIDTGSCGLHAAPVTIAPRQVNLELSSLSLILIAHQPLPLFPALTIDVLLWFNPDDEDGDDFAKKIGVMYS